MAFGRHTGLLLHPTSLPARGGIGDLGPAAYRFLDFLASARQTLWQVLPLGPLGYRNSPYSSTSAFAGNPLLISLERLAERGWLDRSDLEHLAPESAQTDYDGARAAKLPLLLRAAQNFLRRARDGERRRYDQFREEQHWWLEDFAMFAALRRRFHRASWTSWPRELARREPAALDRVRRECVEDLEASRFLQFAFFEQWRALHRYAAERGIRIVGDIAIFISHDSADVWSHPELFHLDANLAPTKVAGVPPDLFSATGQRWGNPLYRWDLLKADGYRWWVQRIRRALETCDIIRLDHFRGFEKYWEIPASEETAMHGHWVDGPKDDLFRALRENLGELPFIAEDLGYITPEVHALRQRWGIPGMRVMQFGFSDSGAHLHLPHNFERNTVVYPGTHDNDTLVGWWRSGVSPAERRAIESYLGQDRDGIHWAFIRAAQTSVADLCLVPMQDVLGLGSEARMNFPSKNEGNWIWRHRTSDLRPELAERLALLAETTDRAGSARHEQSQREAGEDFAA
jgi:4-alpha-glucanotransferase